MKVKASQKDVDRAAKLYKEFRESNPRRGRILEIDWPKTLTSLGYLNFVGYETTRGRKEEKYKHAFAPGSQPTLCADPKTGLLYIIGGRYHVTERGIVDIDAQGKELD